MHSSVAAENEINKLLHIKIKDTDSEVDKLFGLLAGLRTQLQKLTRDHLQLHAEFTELQTEVADRVVLNTGIHQDLIGTFAASSDAGSSWSGHVVG